LQEKEYEKRYLLQTEFSIVLMHPYFVDINQIYMIIVIITDTY